MVKPTVGSKTAKKSQPPVLSHEFIIQNHGDIMSCIVMVFIVGLMFPVTHSLSSLFIYPQYNGTYIEAGTGENGQGREVNGFLSGLRDIPTIFFYSICWIVVHAIVQEYGLDKIQKKAHLSKVSAFKFGESFHQVFFTAYSLGHAFFLISEHPEAFSDIKNFFRIWLGYPDEHRVMSASYKLFFIFQLSYWIHQFPEFYLQKLKRDEVRQKTAQSIIHIVFIVVAYFLNFTRAGLALLILEYTTQLVFHIARLTRFLGRKEISATLFKVYNFIFVLARIGSVIITVMTFWYGLRQVESPYVDFYAGNFNTAAIRLNVLLGVLLLQLYLFYSFASFHMSRFREINAKKEKKKNISAATGVPVPKKEKRRESETDSKKKN